MPENRADTHGRQPGLLHDGLARPIFSRELYERCARRISDNLQMRYTSSNTSTPMDILPLDELDVKVRKVMAVGVSVELYS